MCYSVEEAYHLGVSHRMDDFLIAYPTVLRADLELAWTILMKGLTLTLMVDSLEHIIRLDSFWEQKAQTEEEVTPLPVCVDVDMSFRMFRGKVHLGVRRSPIHSLADFQAIVSAIQKSRHLKFAGVMGYEAQIAGVGDRNPFTRFSNPLIRIFQWLSMRNVKRFRAQIRSWLESEGFGPPGDQWIFNGGGTSSLSRSVQDESLSEVTVGSGFFQGTLFDHYSENMQKPSLVFALPITRHATDGIFTCQSGGFIASGATSNDKLPLPFLPKGLKHLETEGFGEVQTPLEHSKETTLSLSSPVLFRPAKSGEIAERFNEYLLLRNNIIEKRVKTYRGLGYNFF